MFSKIEGKGVVNVVFLVKHLEKVPEVFDEKIRKYLICPSEKQMTYVSEKQETFTFIKWL